MKKARWQRISALFAEAATLEGGEREAWLEQACAGDEALRREVESLLAAHEEVRARETGVTSTVSWGASPVELAPPDGLLRDLTPADDAVIDSAPERIGPWRIGEELGRGGMGVVYAAQRDDGQFEQPAALKLIKRGMDSDQIAKRFLRERQILAQMDDARIARLLDGGVTQDGRPWFALERVDGLPITQY
ncbi:MAG: protein kinase, partial [Pseudomonadota bacterium]